MIIENALVFDVDRGFVPGDVAISGEFFSESAADGEVIDAGGRYAVPGLVDIHQHGSARQDFSFADESGIDAMLRYQASQGVTSLCATTMTLPEDTLSTACDRISGHRCTDGAEILGINLEGPFISPLKPGAQNPAHICPPDAALFRRLQSAARGGIKLVAVAPEESGAIDFIAGFYGEVRVSLAHTAAGYETAAAAFKHGACHVTHLYNAMPAFSHREPGVIGAALDSPDCMVELICDGVHIHPSVVRATLGMFGSERVVFVSDSMMATGLDDGMYSLGGLPVRVDGNRATLADGDAIAGSVTNLMDCVRVAVKSMGVPLHTAVRCASVNPARAVGAFSLHGSIEPGKYADLVILNSDLSLYAVILKGRRLS